MKLNATVEVWSPGRINLIGEHIDYNGGHVMPAALDKGIQLRFQKSNTDKFTVRSLNFDRILSHQLPVMEPSAEAWENYILGVVFQIQQLRPGKLSGFDCELESDLPIGAGISSSAALECGMAKGLNTLFNLGLSDQEIIALSQKAEHSFVGTKCGIMDQYSVVMGKADQFMLLDCRINQHLPVPADLGDYRLVLLNTMVSHSLADSGYNERRTQCETALASIKVRYPEYHFLCDVPEEVLKEFKGQLEGKTYERALFAIQENQRVLAAKEALGHNYINAVGKLMFGSHQGLSRQYGVSCKELDFLVRFAQEHYKKEVLGARMMGGGFGGCTINLVHKDSMDSFVLDAERAYKAAFGIDLLVIPIAIGNGVTVRELI